LVDDGYNQLRRVGALLRSKRRFESIARRQVVARELEHVAVGEVGRQLQRRAALARAAVTKKGQEPQTPRHPHATVRALNSVDELRYGTEPSAERWVEVLVASR
jgi:hypothetical protein